MQDQPAPPSTSVPDIPAGLEAIIIKLLPKKPDDRYPSAEDLRADLHRFLAGQDTSAQRAAGAALAGAALGAAAATTVQPAVDATGAVPVAAQDAIDEEPEHKSRTGVFLAVLVVLLLILAGLLFWFARSLNEADLVEVPATIGLTRAEAEKVLTDLEFKVEVTEEPNATVEAGRVISSDPERGVEAEQGSTVKLLVSSGVEMVAVPDVVGLPQAEAQAALTAAGLRFRVVSVEDTEAEPGTVATQNPPAAQQVAKDTEVELAVSKGTGQELVPDVSGQSLSAAQAALQAAGFRIGGPTEQASATVPKGRVIATDPPAGTSLKKNAVVTVIVSSGVEQVKVPGVVGQTEDNATATLRSRGFDVDVVTKTVPAGDPNVGRVIAQSPASGATADSGSTVSITVGVAAATTTSTSTTTTTTSP